MSPPSSASGVARALCVQGCELERETPGWGGPDTIRGTGLGAGGWRRSTGPLLGRPGEEVRACVCPPHPGPSSPVDLRSVQLWGGPVLPLWAGWGQNISSGNRVESPGFPKAPEPQGKPGCPLPFTSSLQVRAPLQAQASALLTHQGTRCFWKQWPLRCGPARLCVCALPCLVSGPTYCMTWPGVLLASRPVTAPSLRGHDLALTQQQKFGFLKMKYKSSQ